MPPPPPDCASKHALQGYFDSLRVELAPKGLSVTVVSPGYIHTQLSVNAVLGDGNKHGGTVAVVVCPVGSLILDSSLQSLTQQRLMA